MNITVTLYSIIPNFIASKINQPTESYSPTLSLGASLIVYIPSPTESNVLHYVSIQKIQC